MFGKRTRISLGPKTSMNIGKRGTSITTRIAKGMTMTSGKRGTTFTTTTKLGGGFSYSTKTGSGKMTTRLNKPKKGW
jgi:hypothetical protein